MLPKQKNKNSVAKSGIEKSIVLNPQYIQLHMYTEIADLLMYKCISKQKTDIGQSMICLGGTLY